MNKKETNPKPKLAKKKTGRTQKLTRLIGIPESELIDLISKRTGLSATNLRNWRKLGIDIEDENELKKHIRLLNAQPRNLKPEFLEPESHPIDPNLPRDLETLKTELLHTKDKHEASRLNSQISGLLQAQKLEVLNGKYISIDEQAALMAKIGNAIRAMVLRMQSDLPPILDGASPATMQKKINEYGSKILQLLTDGDKQLWQ